MSTPTPNGPTLNDLQFQSFTPAIPFAFSPKIYDQAITNENVVLDLEGYTGSLATEDFTVTSENVVVTMDTQGPNRYSIVTSDTTVTSENVKVLPYMAQVSDTTVTSENITVVKA